MENFQEAFVEFVAQCQARTNAYYENDKYVNAPKIDYEPGKRYIRLVRVAPGERSAFGFIDATNGDVLKAAGWKGPAKNFARGNIFDAKGGLGRVHAFGVQ